MKHDEEALKEGRYWENVIANLSSEGLNFRAREDFVAKDPKCYWEDGRIAKRVLEYPRKAFKGKIRHGMKVLELGSGSGGNSYIMAKLGADVLGMDIQENIVEYLNKEIASEPDLKLKFQVGDLNKADLPENHFDLILSWNTFHHIQNAERLMVEVKKSLKKDGLFVLLEHQHTDSIIRKFLAAFFWLALPTREKFAEKWKIIAGRAKGKSEVELSPAEDSAPEDYIQKLKEAFSVKEEKSYFGFTAPFIARIRAPSKVRSMLVSAINALN
ncbi:class I SAM-dependent methyltransferase [Candidatus Peregrinibacteria bacterium]|nr:class I SAM-dependent methyltransferase [Candidatus Peregrinibacteria bacterium]